MRQTWYLLFLLLKGMTGAMWRSAFVAALFGWHPLHAESVAWVSERKDVLSTFFALLTLAAYARYANESRVLLSSDPEPKVRKARPWPYYAGALVLFALGLMAKPMLVTLPFVMLLLDFWPLKRTGDRRAPGEKPERTAGWSQLALEKAPFLALAALDSAATVWAQKGANSVVSWTTLPFWDRVANALVSYLVYLRQMAWPANLAAIYPNGRTNGARESQPLPARARCCWQLQPGQSRRRGAGPGSPSAGCGIWGHCCR